MVNKSRWMCQCALRVQFKQRAGPLPCCMAGYTQFSLCPTFPVPSSSAAGGAQRNAPGSCWCRCGSPWGTWRKTWPGEPRKDRHQRIKKRNKTQQQSNYNNLEAICFALGFQEYLIVLVSDSQRIPHQHLDESRAFIPNINAVHLLLLLELREK